MERSAVTGTRASSSSAADSLELRLQRNAQSFTRAERALANYMLSNIERIPFDTAASIADTVGVSKMTVSRFLRKNGYQGLADVRRELRRELTIGDLQVSGRVDRFLKGKGQDEKLTETLNLEIEALVKVYERVSTPEWERVVDALSTAPEVLVAGFQMMEGIASIFEIRLQLLRKGVRRIDTRNGTLAEIHDAPAGSVLVLFEMRRYGALSKKIAQSARKQGHVVVIVSDPHCDWANEVSDAMLVVSTETRLFWDSQAAFLSLMNLLLDAVARRLEDSIGARASALDSMVNRFGLLS